MTFSVPRCLNVLLRYLECALFYGMYTTEIVSTWVTFPWLESTYVHSRVFKLRVFLGLSFFIDPLVFYYVYLWWCTLSTRQNKFVTYLKCCHLTWTIMRQWKRWNMCENPTSVNYISFDSTGDRLRYHPPLKVRFIPPR